MREMGKTAGPKGFNIIIMKGSYLDPYLKFDSHFGGGRTTAELLMRALTGAR